MIAYVMIGTRDLARATAFYDRVLEPLGGARTLSSERMQAYGVGGSGGLGVCLPYDGQPATAGNGNMFALAAPSPTGCAPV